MQIERGLPLNFSMFSLEFDSSFSPYKSKWRTDLYEKRMAEFLRGPLGEGSKRAVENLMDWWGKLEPQICDDVKLLESAALRNDRLPDLGYSSLDLNGTRLPYLVCGGKGEGCPSGKPFTIPDVGEKFGCYDFANPIHEAYDDWYQEEYRKWVDEDNKRYQNRTSLSISLDFYPKNRPTPPNYPIRFMGLDFDVEDKLVFKALKIIHYARRKDQWLVESHFKLWHGYLVAAQQIVKDNVFFPNPKKGRLWANLEEMENTLGQLDGPYESNLEDLEEKYKMLKRAAKRVKQGFLFIFKPTGGVGQREGFISQEGFVYSNGIMVKEPNSLKNLDVEKTVQALANISLFQPAVTLK